MVILLVAVRALYGKGILAIVDGGSRSGPDGSGQSCGLNYCDM